MGRYISALAGTTVALLCGVWLVVSPWVLRYPQPAEGWGATVLTQFWTGVGVVALSGVTLLLYGREIAHVLRALASGHSEAPEHLGRHAQPLAPDDQREDLDELLVPIATALLSDLAGSRGAEQGHPEGVGS